MGFIVSGNKNVVPKFVTRHLVEVDFSFLFRLISFFLRSDDDSKRLNHLQLYLSLFFQCSCCSSLFPQQFPVSLGYGNVPPPPLTWTEKNRARRGWLRIVLLRRRQLCCNSDERSLNMNFLTNVQVSHKIYNYFVIQRVFKFEFLLSVVENKGGGGGTLMFSQSFSFFFGVFYLVILWKPINALLTYILKPKKLCFSFRSLA